MNMYKPVIISGEKFGEEDIRQFLADTEKLTGAKVNITPQWAVYSEDASLMLALEALFGILPFDEIIAPVKLTETGQRAAHRTGPRKTKRGKSAGEPASQGFTLKPAPPQAVKSWRVLDTTGNVLEFLTADEKNLRLLNGEFEEGAILHHPEAGKQRVIGAKGRGQGMEPMEV